MNKVSLFPQGAYIYDVRKKQIKQPRLREVYSTYQLPTADKGGRGVQQSKSLQTAYVYGPSMPNFASESESVAAGRLPFTRLLH